MSTFKKYTLGKDKFLCLISLNVFTRTFQWNPLSGKSQRSTVMIVCFSPASNFPIQLQFSLSATKDLCEKIQRKSGRQIVVKLWPNPFVAKNIIWTSDQQDSPHKSLMSYTYVECYYSVLTQVYCENLNLYHSPSFLMSKHPYQSNFNNPTHTELSLILFYSHIL